MRRGRGDWLALFCLAMGVRMATAAFIPRPGYMDAAYYAAGAVRVARGGGLSEPFIWNYLNDPAGVPHPGFLYWMPLPSLLAAPFAALFRGSFFALQFPFAILSALIPLVAYGLARRVTGSRGLAWAAGLLAVFSGFFFPYWTLPETFAPFALFGGAALWLAGGGRARGGTRMAVARWLVSGALVGLAHLTRADGILLLPVVALGALVSDRVAWSGDEGEARAGGTRLGAAIRRVLLLAAGYLVVMGPWFVRNVVVMGAPLSSAGSKTIWLTNYDDLFCYDCELTPATYLAWGWGNVLRSKLAALWINFQRLLAEGGMVFLLPFAVVGFYRVRGHLRFVLAAVYLVGVYVAHSLVFTFPGWRGGFFHASAAALPFLYAAGMEGLDAAVRWVARRRRTWRYEQARAVFGAGAVGVAIILSGIMVGRKIPAWRAADAVYGEVDRWLADQGTADAGVMVGNPPAFWYHTGRAAIVIPNGGVETLLEAADRYGMRYALLEPDHPAALAGLYAGEDGHPRLRAEKTWSEGETILYAIER